jgi:hypothetical protein
MRSSRSRQVGSGGKSRYTFLTNSIFSIRSSAEMAALQFCVASIIRASVANMAALLLSQYMRQ